MAKENYNTPYEKAVCPVPAGDTATMAGQRGGYDFTDMPKETPNMSELGLNMTGPLDVKDGPAPWSTVAVGDGIASPSVPAANIPKIGS